MKKYLKWFQMLSLRLYKKPSFIAILLVIPICVIGFAAAAKGDSGFLHIVLAQDDKNDTISGNIISELVSENSIIRFSVAESPEEAEDFVRTGKADAAWIFPKKLDEKIEEFVSSSYFKGEFVEIIERESSVPLRLAHEKLSVKLFRVLAEKYYIDFTRREAPSLDGMDDNTLMHYYNTVSISEELFIVTDVDGNEADTSVGASYLTSPVRGLLSIVIILSGMAASMFCIQDERRGTFSWLSESRRIYVDMVCVFISVLNISAVAYIALLIGGLSTGIFREAIAILLYVLCSSFFCLILRQIFRTVKLYGVVLPLVIITMIAVCPIFFEIKQLGGLVNIFPPSLYINASHNNACLLYMLIYAALSAVICIVLDRILRLRTFRTK